MTAEESLPPGWGAYAGTLIRLTNDVGTAVAWLDPEHGANCVAFAVRDDGEWVQLLHNAGPAALSERPSRFGIPILFPFPGHMRDFRYHWRGVTYDLPRRGSLAASFTHGFAHTHPWQVIARESGRAVLAFTTPDAFDPDQRAGYPFHIRLTDEVAIVGDALRITLTATNTGEETAPVGIGLHPYFAVAGLGGDRTRVGVELPGRHEHVQANSVPTGVKHAVGDPAVAVPPLGETANVARTDLAPHARATLTDPAGRRAIEMAFIEGVRDVVYFAPTDQPSISVEPHTCAPGAASQAAGHPDGLMPLDPGSSRVMTVEIALRLPGGAVPHSQ